GFLGHEASCKLPRPGLPETAFLAVVAVLRGKVSWSRYDLSTHMPVLCAFMPRRRAGRASRAAEPDGRPVHWTSGQLSWSLKGTRPYRQSERDEPGTAVRAVLPEMARRLSGFRNSRTVRVGEVWRCNTFSRAWRPGRLSPG